MVCWSSSTSCRMSVWNRAPTVRLLEVVDIAPVGGLGLGRGVRAEEAADQRALAASRRTHDEEVVAGAAHPHAEPRGVHGARLPHAVGQVLQLGGRGEGEATGIAGTAQPFGRERRWARAGRAAARRAVHRTTTIRASTPRGIAAVSDSSRAT